MFSVKHTRVSFYAYKGRFKLSTSEDAVPGSGHVDGNFQTQTSEDIVESPVFVISYSGMV